MDFNIYKNNMPFGTPRSTERLAYRAEERRLYDLFKRDALAETGLTNHPKASNAFNMAWERGHAEGLASVLYELGELAELLLD